MAANAQMERQEIFYFTPHLLRRLERMLQSPLTVIEAPSGFGKTTAVREFMGEFLSPYAQVHWYTCSGDSPEKAWSGICSLLENADTEVAAILRALNIPTLETLPDTAALLRRFQCDGETFLIIDNYQLLSTGIPHEIIRAFSMHGNRNLHIVFITQQLGAEYIAGIHTPAIHHIDAASFFFDKDSIRTFFRKNSIRLSKREIDAVHNTTEGWISAIRLQMLNYQQTGTFADNSGIEHLIQTAVWDRLSDPQKNFLLAVSVLDHFTPAQAQILFGERVLTAEVTSMLEGNVFIRYYPDQGVYFIHSILRSYLQNRFVHDLSVEARREIYCLAGKAYASIGECQEAADCFFNIGDYASILALPFHRVAVINQLVGLSPIALKLCKNCTREQLIQCPLTLVVMAFHLFFDAHYEEFGYLCDIVGEAIRSSGLLSEADRRHYSGELALIDSFTHYNDIERMSAGHRAAFELLGGPSRFILIEDAWTFGGVSALCMFWSKTGELARELDLMDECIPIYNKLTRGHGSGAQCVMRAEALLLEGKDNDAEALCHKALYLAGAKQQDCLCFGAELTLARIAVLRGDFAGYRGALESMQTRLVSGSERLLGGFWDLCRGYVKSILGDSDENQDMPVWLTTPESIADHLHPTVIPFGHIILGRWYLRNNLRQPLRERYPMWMEMAGQMHYLLPQVYHRVHLAVCLRREGQDQEALHSLLEALQIALPDRVYLPFVESGTVLSPLLEQCKLHGANRGGINEILRLSERQAAGIAGIRAQAKSARPVLTHREREIALLARENLSNKEIAATLFISGETVKGALKDIYRKLDIHSKTQLKNHSI